MPTEKDTDLHLYLKNGPDVFTFPDLLSLYGFEFIRTEDRFLEEPVSDYFQWSLDPISEGGFQLIFFHDLFKDDLNYGKYDSFVVMSGNSASSKDDLNMIDVFSLLLLSRYDGRLHNPQRIDKISTSFLLSGKPFAGFSKRS